MNICIGHNGQKKSHLFEPDRSFETLKGVGAGNSKWGFNDLEQQTYVHVSTFTCAYTINHHYWTSARKKYEKSIKKKTSWMAVMVKHACRNWLWLRAYPGASLKVATFRHHHESTRFTIHAFLFINLQHQKKVGPSTARHPTERSCVFVFCDLLASSDGGTLDTAFLVYGLIGCKCHELRNFSDNKNTWRCFLMNPQKTRSGVSKENVLFKCVF